MKFIGDLVTFAVLVCGLVAVQSAKTSDLAKHLSKLSEANFKLSLKLYKQVAEDESITNLVFSPMSIVAGKNEAI